MLFRSFFALLKKATESDSLPHFLQKEQQGLACSLALYKKSDGEWLAPLLFTKKQQGAAHSLTLFKKSKRGNCFITKRVDVALCSFCTEGNPVFSYLYSLFVLYKKSKKELFALHHSSLLYEKHNFSKRVTESV